MYNFQVGRTSKKRDHTLTKEGDLDEMGDGIREDVHGQVMFVQ